MTVTIEVTVLGPQDVQMPHVDDEPWTVAVTVIRAVTVVANVVKTGQSELVVSMEGSTGAASDVAKGSIGEFSEVVVGGTKLFTTKGMADVVVVSAVTVTKEVKVLGGPHVEQVEHAVVLGSVEELVSVTNSVFGAAVRVWVSVIVLIGVVSIGAAVTVSIDVMVLGPPQVEHNGQVDDGVSCTIGVPFSATEVVIGMLAS